MEKQKMNPTDEYRERITLEEAAEITVSHTPVITETENIPLADADGRILARDMITETENPPFDRSPIDGYACRSADIRDASKDRPAVLRVVAEIDAGQYYEGTVQAGEAVRIMTGAPIPGGCDCCVWQENTDYGEETVAVREPVPAHGNFCDRGEDFGKGVLMARAGERLNCVDIADLAAMGVSDVPVFRAPRIALYTTGNELARPGQPLAPGKIYDSNLPLLAARLKELGMPAQWSGHLDDEAEVVAGAIRKAAEEGADLILTTGGVSVGRKDILHEAIGLLGAEKLFWRVQIKPGMPTIFSTYRNIPIVSLSGNPFGALANTELLVRPMLAKMTGDPSLLLRRVSGILTDDFPKASPGRRFIRAYYSDGAVSLPGAAGTTVPSGTGSSPGAAGTTVPSGTGNSPGGEPSPGRPASPGAEHSSGVLSSMRHCNCFVDIPAGSPALTAGGTVTVCLLARD